MCTLNGDCVVVRTGEKKTCILCRMYPDVKCEVLMPVIVNFWDVTPNSFVDHCCYFKGICCSNLEVTESISYQRQ
jgi:hypothetical protein